MFKLGQSDRYSYPVNVEIVGDGGARQVFTFDAVFRRLSADEYAAMMRRARDGEIDDITIARDVLWGWDKVVDDAGEKLAFSETNRDVLLNVWPVLPALMAAFLESNTPKGKTKN